MVKDTKALKRIQDAIINDKEAANILGTETVIYLLDVSGSMGAYMESHTFVSKIEALRKATRKIFEARLDYQRNCPDAEDEISIVLFPGKDTDRWGHGGGASVLLHPCRLEEKHINKIDRLKHGGGTPMGDALRRTSQLVDVGMNSMIRLVILSDGCPQEKEQCLGLVREMVDRLGVVIDTIGVGSMQDLNGRHGYDEAFLREIAEVGNGTFTHVGDAADFEAKMLATESAHRALFDADEILLLEASTESD